MTTISKKTAHRAPPPPPPVIAGPVATPPPPPPIMINFPGKGDITLDEARKFAGTYGQFLKKPSPELCPEGEASPTCRADVAAVATVMHTKDYADTGKEDARTMAIVSVDTLYSLAPSEETFLLMLTLRQQLGIDLVRLQRKIDTTESTSAASWGPSTYLMSDVLALKTSFKHLDKIDAKLTQTAWTLEKAVAQKLSGDHRAAIHAAITRAHSTDPMTAHLQSARMEVLVGNRDAALDFLSKAQTVLNHLGLSTPNEQLAQITVWHRQATLMATLGDRKKLLQNATALLEKLPKATPQRNSLAIENLALIAQLDEQEIRAILKGNSDEDTVYRIRAIYDSAVTKAERLVEETNAKGHRIIKLDPLLELKATLAEQQLGIAFAWYNFGDSMTQASRIRKGVEDQLTKDVDGYSILVHPQTLSAYKSRHYWAMAQYDFFTGNIQSALVHLQTIASQHQGSRHEAMLWDKDNWPFLTGIVSGDRNFSETLNHKSITAGAKTFMQAYLKRRGTAFMGCEVGALAFTLGTAVITRQFSSTAALTGCFAGNAGVAMDTWMNASDFIRQSYVTGLTTVTDVQTQELRNTLLMQTAVMVASGMGGVVAQNTVNAITAPLQRRLLASVVVSDAPWLSGGMAFGFREASHVAGGLTMGSLSNIIYESLGETQHQLPLTDHWLTYSALSWIGHLNIGARIFDQAGVTGATARAFTNISAAGWTMAGYGTLRHPSDAPFLEQAADTTALMGILHGTLSFGRWVQSSGKVKIPQPLDELTSTLGDTSVPIRDTPVDLIARRRVRRNSDRMLGVNAIVTAHIDTFIEEVARVTALAGRFDPALESRIHLARAALNELVALSDAGLVVDVRQLDIVWKTPSLTQHDFRVATLRILEGQVGKGHIKRVEPGVVAYVVNMETFHLPEYFRVVDPHSWGLTRTNIAGLTEAAKLSPGDPILKYIATKAAEQIRTLPSTSNTLQQFFRDTLVAEFKRQNFDIETQTELTPIPDFQMPNKMVEGEPVN